MDKLDEEAMQRMLKVEHGGMSEVLANLYAVTGEPAHLALARRFDHKAFLEPLAARARRAQGAPCQHPGAESYRSRREYELTGEPFYRDVATYFWDQVVNHRSYATAGPAITKVSRPTRTSWPRS